MRQIIGEEFSSKYDLSFIINSGIDSHSFNPSVSDIARVKTSDMFIFVGGHSDAWVESVLRDANPEMIVVNLLELLDSAVLSGDGFGCDPDCDDDHSHTVFDVDEHVWLSLRLATQACIELTEYLIKLDPVNTQMYEYNTRNYTYQLMKLDSQFQEIVDAAENKWLVFADRFPFRYMMADYGLLHNAAFSGCSAETEVSFSTIIALANRINQLGVTSVFVTETSDQSIARTVISNTETKDQSIHVLSALKSVTLRDARNGVTYLDVMRENLEVLRQALN
jgi:zinc transport system substrate-binding protein